MKKVIGKILTAFKVCSVLAEIVRKMGLHPQEFGFHAFRRSGASLVFNANIPLEYRYMVIGKVMQFGRI